MLPPQATRFFEHRRHAGIQAVLFVLAISLPLAANLVGVDGADPRAENRQLAPMPIFEGWRSATDYAGGLTRWFEDHFGFRATLLRLHARAHFFLLGSSPSPAVALGADGWLFYADDGAIEDYANERALSAGELNAWRQAGRRARDWLGTRGIAYVFTVAPDKHAIYPELVPRTIRRLGAVSRTDQVLAALADEQVVVVDLRPPLHAAKTRERIYHVTDTHWNGRGAWVAYAELIDAIRAQQPAVPPPWPRSHFDAVSRETAGRDLARMSGLAGILTEDDLDLVPRQARRARVVEPSGALPSAEVGRLVTEIPGSTLPRLLVFRDSFASSLAPFLSEHFSRAVYLWQNDFDATAVLAERPDVVVHEIVGRHLYSFTPTPDLVPR